MTTRAQARKRWVAVHLWVALIVGFPLALLGASGALLVLKAPLLRWEVGAAAFTAVPQALPLAGETAWKAAAVAAYPQFDRVMGALAPRAGFMPSDNALVFGSLHDRKGFGIAALDPYTAEARAFFVFDDLKFSWVVALHRALLLPGAFGAWLVAVCGLALLASLMTGVWLWWPKGKAWWTPFKIRASSRGYRRWSEWHQSVAGVAWMPLLVLAITGTILAVPQAFALLHRDSADIKAVFVALHGELMLGVFGQALVLAAGLTLPLLYVTGLVMWWRKQVAKGRASPCRVS